MSWQKISLLPNSGRGDGPGEAVSYRVERHVGFGHGYVELRRYHWSKPVEDLIFVTDEVLALNMALTSRPASTRIVRDDGEKRAAPFEGGRLMIMMPGTRYALTAPGGTLRSLHCAFRREKFTELLGDGIDWDDWRGMDELDAPGSEIEGLMRRIHRELRLNQIGRDAAIEAYASVLCIELARGLRTGQPARPDLHRGGLAAWRMNLLRERIAADAPAPRLTELADLCGLTTRQLSRAFKAETGKTIGRLVDEMTVERAQRLLAGTDLSIAAIAARLGFASVDTFSQSFRRQTGMLPSQVRLS